MYLVLRSVGPTIHISAQPLQQATIAKYFVIVVLFSSITNQCWSGVIVMEYVLGLPMSSVVFSLGNILIYNSRLLRVT